MKLGENMYDEVAQNVAYTTLLAFNDLDGAHLLILLKRPWPLKRGDRVRAFPHTLDAYFGYLQ